MGCVQRVHAVLLQNLHRRRVAFGELSLEVEEEVSSLSEIVTFPSAVQRHDRYSLHDRGIKLDEAPRALENFLRLKEHEYAGVFDVREKLA